MCEYVCAGIHPQNTNRHSINISITCHVETKLVHLLVSVTYSVLCVAAVTVVAAEIVQVVAQDPQYPGVTAA